ncbi:hypothetical protein BDQ12DRAFT_688937 [Crucibulum laeve]|uniref:F-box domain-containing protein n=1 Tax=Crucibulum laeve TaxID=68775 RepID=A0A5C3M1H2_9AGAR|nr:hypothetical protein BDQ12DRAFT_688937 [Crucibulum laeve]
MLRRSKLERSRNVTSVEEQLTAATRSISTVEDNHSIEYSTNNTSYEGGNVMKRRKVTDSTIQTPTEDQAKVCHEEMRDGFADMPLEILFEKFIYLEPIDLLRLARTTKAFRNILMHQPTARKFWKQARLNLGVPECPEDLSEPQYANLAFDDHCHYCLASNAILVVWLSRVRCCTRCGYEAFIPTGRVSSDVRSVVPYTTELPPGSNKAGTNAPYQKMYCLESAKCLSKAFLQLSTGERKQWQADRAEELKKREEHAAKFQTWQLQRASQQRLEEARLERERYDAIVLRLTALGWGDEIKVMDQYILRNHYQVHQPKPLTESVWTDIKHILVELMEEVKAERLERLHCAVVRKRCSVMTEIYKNFVASQPLHTVIPGFTDVVLMDPFRTIIEDTPVDEEVTEENFNIAETELPDLAKDWRHARDAELLSMLHASPSVGSGSALDSLHLATTLFKCKHVGQPVSYPRILVHEHATPAWDYSDNRPGSLLKSVPRKPWNYGGSLITFDEVAHHYAKTVLQVCGFDPETTTSEDMQRAKPWVECTKCFTAKSGRRVMRWDSAIQHGAGAHPYTGLPSESLTFKLLDERATAKALHKEMRYMRDHFTDTTHRDWCCVRCKMRGYFTEIQTHLTEQHGVDNPEEPTDYTEHLDSSTFSPMLWLKI